MSVLKRYFRRIAGRGEDLDSSEPLLGAKEEERPVRRWTDTDGVQSWLVALCIFLVNFAMLGHGRASGILFVDFMRIFHVNRQVAASPYSVQQSVRMLCGPAVEIVGYMFGLRAVAVTGCAIAALSCAVAYFAHGIGLITITWGGMLGIGVAFTSTINLILIEQYFLRYRSLASSFAFSGACVGAFIFPVVIDILVHRYGLHGTFLIMGAVLLNVLPFALLLRNKKTSEHLKDEERDRTLPAKKKSYNSFSERETSFDNSSRGPSTSEQEDGLLTDPTSDFFFNRRSQEESDQEKPQSLKVRAEVNIPRLKSSPPVGELRADIKQKTSDPAENQKSETTFTGAISKISSEIEALTESTKSIGSSEGRIGITDDSKRTVEEVTSDASDGSKVIKKITEGFIEDSSSILEAADESAGKLKSLERPEKVLSNAGSKISTFVGKSKTIKTMTEDLEKDMSGAFADSKDKTESSTWSQKVTSDGNDKIITVVKESKAVGSKVTDGSTVVKKVTESLIEDSSSILDAAGDSVGKLKNRERPEKVITEAGSKISTLVGKSKTIKTVTEDLEKDISNTTGDSKDKSESSTWSQTITLDGGDKIITVVKESKAVENVTEDLGEGSFNILGVTGYSKSSDEGRSTALGAISKLSGRREGTKTIKNIAEACKVVSEKPVVDITETRITKEVEVLHAKSSDKKKRIKKPDVYKKTRHKRTGSSSFEARSSTSNEYGINFNFLHENADIVLDLLTNKIPIGDEEMMPATNEITQNDLESPDMEFISQELQQIERQFQKPQEQMQEFLSSIRDKLGKFQQQLDNDRGQILQEKKLNLDGKELLYKDIRNTTIRRSSCTIEIFEYTCEIPVELYIPIKLQELYERSSSHILTYYNNNERISVVLRQLRKLHEIFSGETCGYTKDKRPSHLLESTAFRELSKSEGHRFGRTERPPSTLWECLIVAFKMHFNPMFFLICLCRCLHVLTFLPVVTTVVDFATDKGLAESQGIYAILALSGGDLLGRLKSGFVLKMGCCSDSAYMVIGLILQGIATAVLPQARGIVVFISLALFGFSQGAVFTRHPLILMKYLNPHEKTIGLGSLNFFPGLIGLCIPYYIGYTRDKLGSYDLLYFINGGLAIFVGLLWLLEPLLRRFAPPVDDQDDVSPTH